MPNSLTREVSWKLGPIALDTLFKHYFDHVKKERTTGGTPLTQLRQDELLYDETFNIVKRFLDVATHHSVEELQAFSKTYVPSPPSVHVARVTVPMSCCNEAASLLIQALGGEEHTSLLVGGTKWWQVRGAAGIPGEWVTARKDWKKDKKRQRASQKKKPGHNDFSKDATNASPSSISEPSSISDGHVDEFCCILFIHGGGYYFGSLDQERHCLQRLARKTRGRVFAVNYRLAPQYPFPCALQDLVAAYLYLIKPPPDATHQPMKPSQIVVTGDSAGGGLALALLQVLRDTSQPLPAGSVLISPWCDLTHSFPSIHTNTATDVLPLYGLTFHKPSALWPPPSEELTRKIHSELRQRVRQIAGVAITGNNVSEATTLELTQDILDGLKHFPSGEDEKFVSGDIPVDVATTTILPPVNEKENQTISLETNSGEKLKIDSQIHLYTQNSLLVHPFVSPVLSYLGGLCPLFIIAGDKEVLRDEIIYLAHRAADPPKFFLTDEVRSLYPPLVDIENRYGPTQVHLQVYDDTAHVLPVIFPFTTPAKYCYRAITTFTKHVTGIFPATLSPSYSEMISSAPNHTADTSAAIPDSSNLHSSLSWPIFFSSQTKSTRVSSSGSTPEWSFRRGQSNSLHSKDSQNVENPSKLQRDVSTNATTEVHYAGETNVYHDEEGLLSWKEGMIRERVSTRGIIRPLEPADELDALLMSPATIGVLPDRTMRRYFEGKALFDQKYAKVLLRIEKERNRSIDLARKDVIRNLMHPQALQDERAPGKQKEASQALRDELELSSGTWAWAWADERPPPSSIVCRCDTDESRRLARIADQSVIQDEAHMNSNKLWTVIVNFLTISPPKERPASDSEAANPAVKRAAIKRSESVFASRRTRERQPKNRT